MSSRQPSSEKCQVGAVLVASRASSGTRESDSASAMGMSVAIGEGGGFSHVKNDGQRRGESAAVTERDGNVQGDHFDAHGAVAMADSAGAGGQARPPRHDDAVPFFESHQEQVVQAS